MELLSIVTPSYNRGAYLKRCFASLCGQTDPRFEWIIVDDGSTDETAELVRGFQRERPEFPIRYLYKENGGKHTALNASHPLITGSYVLVLDSDDQLIPTAVAEILSGWAGFERNTVGVLVFLKGFSVNDPFAVGKQEYVPLDMYRKHFRAIHSRDFCDVFRAEVFKRYPYPVFPGEAFLSECVPWNLMAQTLQLVYINKVLCLAQYLDDGLTRSGRAMRIRVPVGGMYASNQFTYRHFPLPLRLKNSLLYNCYSYFAKAPVKKVLKEANAPALTLLTRPGGWFIYHFWKKKYGTKN